MYVFVLPDFTSVLKMTSEFFSERVADTDYDINHLLAAASNTYELTSGNVTPEDANLIPTLPTNCTRFAQPKSNN